MSEQLSGPRPPGERRRALQAERAAGKPVAEEAPVARRRTLVRPKVSVRRPAPSGLVAPGRHAAPPGPDNAPDPTKVDEGDLKRTSPATRPVSDAVSEAVAEPADAAPGAVLPAAVARRRWWRRWPAAVLGALLVVALAVTAGIVLARPRSAPPAPAAVAAPQSTLLAVLATPDRTLVASSLLAADSQGAQSVLVPSRLVLDVPGAGRGPLSASLLTSDAGPGQAVADALDVRVDGVWVLTTSGLATLVDAAGGVVVDVDSQVSSDGVLIAAGKAQKLTGAQAVAYASYLGNGEAEQARLSRFGRVLEHLLATLPTDQTALKHRLAAAGDQSRTTMTADALSAALVPLVKFAASGKLDGTVLPVKQIETGGDTNLYGLDQAAATQLVDARLAGAKRPVPPGGVVRVLVQNGVGTPGLGELARTRLVAAGFRFVGGGNAAQFGRETTQVLVKRDDPTQRARGMAVAHALGLGSQVVAVGQDAPTVADVVVVLGADFAALATASPSGSSTSSPAGSSPGSTSTGP